jgi:hypothetical protein
MVYEGGSGYEGQSRRRIEAKLDRTGSGTKKVGGHKMRRMFEKYGAWWGFINVIFVKGHF